MEGQLKFFYIYWIISLANRTVYGTLMRQDEVEGMYTRISYIVPWNDELNAKTILTV